MLRVVGSDFVGHKNVWTVRRAVAIALAAASAYAGPVLAQEQARADNHPRVAEVNEEIVVVGSRLRPEEGGESQHPVVVFSTEDIARTGATNVADVLNYLPQSTYNPNGRINPDGTIIQLRGLTVGNTLVLINGRRASTSSSLIAADSFNLNSIPLTSVARIEVLSDSASAIYGTDATGGVVNIVLKDKIDSPTVNLYYGGANGGADEERATVGLGHEGERYKFSVSGDYFKRGFLDGSERSEFFDENYKPYGGTDYRSPIAPLTNITAVVGTLPGLGSRTASVLPGGTGQVPGGFSTTPSLASLLAGADVIPASLRRSALGNGEFHFTDDLKMFGEFLYTDQYDVQQAQAPTITGAVLATNPYNPFGVPVAVTRQLVEAGGTYTNVGSKLYRGTLGVDGKLFSSWDWEAYVLDSSESTTSTYINQVNTTAVAKALASTSPTVTPNLFSSAPIPAAIVASMLNPPNDDDNTSDNLQASAYLRGSVWDLPAGPLSLVVGAEPRVERVHFEAHATNQNFSRKRTIVAEFAEMRVPIFSDSMDIPLLDRLTLTAAGRNDHYSDFGSTFNPQFGAEWSPVKLLNLRTSYGHSFRAPTLFEMYEPTLTTRAAVVDPARKSVQEIITQTTGGNKGLRPETASTYATGFDLTPEWNGSPRLSLTYWRIQEENRLQALTSVGAIQSESFFPDRIQRNAPTAADIAAGQPGAISTLNLTVINAGSLDTSGVDLQLSASWDTDWGTFSPSFNGTQVTRYQAANFPGSAVIDHLALAGNTAVGVGSVPRLRGTLSLPYGFNGYELAPILRYISSYKDVNALGLPSGTSVSSQTLVDLQATLDAQEAFGQRIWSKGLTLRAGAVNLLNKRPPFAQVGTVLGYDYSQGDIRGRFIYGSIEYKF